MGQQYQTNGHANPADYGLSIEEAKKMRLAELQRMRKIAQWRVSEGVRLKVNARPQDKWFVDASLTDWQNELDALDRQIRFLKANRNTPLVDLETIKECVKIRDVLNAAGVKIERNNTFKIRDERTPSAHFNEKKNLWYDFGSSEGGSVIDLYMKLYKTDISGAVSALRKAV